MSRPNRVNADGVVVPLTDDEVLQWQHDTDNPPKVVSSVFLFAQFLALFTDAEQTALVNAPQAQIKTWLLSNAGGQVNLADQRMKNALSRFVTLGILTQDRATAILGATQ